MTDLLGRTGHEQLEIDLSGPDDHGVERPVDITTDIARSPAYTELRELRDAAEGRNRSGPRAIAREALRAFLAGDLTQEEYLQLFPERNAEPVAEQPPRELDWAERAAGEDRFDS